MNKFDKLYEETINEITYDQVSDKEYQEIADKINLISTDAKIFIALMKNRFKGSPFSATYVLEWAERIKNKRAWIYGDSVTRKALAKLGYKLGKDEEQIKKSQKEQK